MSKVATLFALAVLLSFTLMDASRPNYSFENLGLLPRVEIEGEKCEEGLEECFWKRTLAAHLDYIYTQNAKEGQHD